MRGYKLMLDIMMGAIIPIVVLQWFSGPLTAPVAYVVSALIPVGWVLADLLFITKRFNFITSYAGIAAMVRGALAFWFVDGVLFAFKDTLGIILTIALFGVSVAIGKPLLQYFLIQGMNPPTLDQEKALKALLQHPSIWRRFMIGTALFAGLNVVLGVVNFWLNLSIVVEPFGTEIFNQQVAQVNAIMRVVSIPEMALLMAAFIFGALAVFRVLPTEPGRSPWESDFWELMRLHGERESASAASDPATQSAEFHS
ncbi:MAG: VC0807 family protein [Dehalococcoidia bacterium]